jgi:hypothetical protein
VLCNVEGVDAEALAMQAARLWFGLPTPTPTPRPTPRPTVPAESYVKLPPAELAALAGVYYEPNTTRLLRLNAVGDRLRFDDTPELELAALDSGHFRFFSSGSPTPGEAFFDATGASLEVKNTLALNGSYRRYPDLAAGPDYTGTYYSPELDTSYRISLDRGILTLHSRRFVDVSLVPADDAAPGGPRFEMMEALPPITVEFRPAPVDPGRIEGFAFSLDRARNVRFDRAP